MREGDSPQNLSDTFEIKRHSRRSFEEGSSSQRGDPGPQGERPSLYLGRGASDRSDGNLFQRTGEEVHSPFYPRSGNRRGRQDGGLEDVEQGLHLTPASHDRLGSVTVCEVQVGSAVHHLPSTIIHPLENSGRECTTHYLFYPPGQRVVQKWVPDVGPSSEHRREVRFFSMF